MSNSSWIAEVRAQYQAYKKACERAAAQVGDEQFFESINGTHTSIGMLMKHLGGNHYSRWRDFLTADGEKNDRDRESEFVTVGETRASVLEKWERGWKTAFDALDSLTQEDIEREVTIRGEPTPVRRAILRNLNHVSYHAGQIVMIARGILGEQWEFLSIPPGKSSDYNDSMRAKFGDWKG